VPGRHRGGLVSRLVPSSLVSSSLVSSFRYAIAGLWWTVKTQRNMRIHVTIGVAAFILGAILRLSALEFAVIALTATVVMAAEMINTVVEAAVDLASPEYHPLAKIAKDVAAGAVLVTALGAVAVGLFIFLPHLGGHHAV
jgi:diacylglycerol kinase